MKKINLVILLLFILSACNSLKEAGKILKNEKIRTTDEFLVKKRTPLVLPPEYEKMPIPGSSKEKTENNEKKIKNILRIPEIQESNKTSSSTEKSILDRIRK